MSRASRSSRDVGQTKSRKSPSAGRDVPRKRRADSGAIPEGIGIETLHELVHCLESAGVNYWLGRGLFRQFTLHKNFGDRQGDIDFHVLREEHARLQSVVTDLTDKGYELISGPEHGHKVTIRKRGVKVEFVFLERDGDILWHQAGWPRRKRYDSPARAFGDRRVEMFGVSVRVPNEEYLPAVFGSGWRKNTKGSGGRLMP